MGLGVVTELKALVVQVGGDLGVAPDLLTGLEEGRRDFVLPQDGCDALRPLRVRPVVEGERDLIRLDSPDGSKLFALL